MQTRKKIIKRQTITNDTTIAVANDLVRQVRKLTDTSMPLEILEILTKHLNLKASTFYSISDITKEPSLTLRAQIGVSYSDYKSFALSIDSTAGRCVRSEQIEYVKDVQKSRDYRDKDMAIKHDLTKMLAIPLQAMKPNIQSQSSTNMVGVLCLYPNENTAISSLKKAVNQLRSIIAEVYIQDIQAEKLRFREIITQRAAASADLNSFLHRTCKVIKENWPYEAITTFVYDERSNLLRLGATTGIIGDKPKHEAIVDLENIECTESECFNNKSSLMEIFPAEALISEDGEDKVEGNTVARLLMPILEPAHDPKNRRPIGVLRVTNKILRHDGRREVFYFGWEDIEFFRFVCDVLGVIAGMFDRVSKSKDDFERSLHGVQNNLNGVLGSIEFISALLVKSPELNKHSYILPSARAQLQALSWQIERFSGSRSSEKSSTNKCNLISDVFAKLGPLLRPLSQSFSITQITLPNFNNDLYGIPAVAAEPNDIIIVFRNLFENAIKYNKNGKSASISIAWSSNDGNVMIDISDHGIGISEKEKNRVFHEGFRSENAMRRRSLGAGLGLFQCKEILMAIKGNIELISHQNPTTFRVTIPIAK